MKKILLALITLITLQTQAQCWKELSVGDSYTIAIKQDGTMWGWGNNIGFKLGLGEGAQEYVYEPVQIGTDDDWKHISASVSHNLAIKDDGTLWVWGNGADDLFSLGVTDNDVPVPVKVNDDTNWKMVDAGLTFSIALKTDGTLWSWGTCDDGELGHGYNGMSWDIPLQIGNSSDWEYISVGLYHVMAIKTDGALWGWGNFDGISEWETQPTPMQIGNDTDWTSVAAGYLNDIILRNNGTLWQWPLTFGQSLGDPDYSNPLYTQVGTDTWLSVTAYAESRFCVKSDGTLWAWGRNENKQIQYDAGNNIYEPLLIGSSDEWDFIASGRFHTAGIKSGGTLVAWGNNSFGQLGTGNTNPQTEQFTVSCSTTASLNENTLSQISLYPNPTSNMLTLTNVENLTIESLRVTDMTGKVVINQTGNSPQLNVEKLPAGMYFLNVSAQEGSQHLKFIKE